MATIDEITATLTFLAATYPRFQMTEHTAAAYAMGLDDVPAAALETAARELAKTSKWFPTLSELREIALQYSDRRQISDDEARRMARRLLISWRCCPTCWQHPCACHPELTVEDDEKASLPVGESY